MSIEKAIISQSHSALLSSRLKSIIRTETEKGCSPDIFPYPVDLEPPFFPIPELSRSTSQLPKDLAIEKPYTNNVLPVRLRIWISPSHKLEWVSAELFLKSLGGIKNRMGFEIIGNSEGIRLFYLVHNDDVEVLKTAYTSQYCECKLTEPHQGLPVDINKYDWGNSAVVDYYPMPPYSHLFTQPNEFKTSPLETAITAIKELHRDECGIIQFLFQPVNQAHNWHENINILLDLEFSIKLLSGFSMSPQMLYQQPSGEIHGMAKDVRVKAHNDKPIFAGALRMAVLGPDNDNLKRIQKLRVFGNLFQHGGKPLRTLTESKYSCFLSPAILNNMFALGISYRPGFILNTSELAGMVHIPATSEIELREFPVDLLKKLPVKDGRLLTGTPVGVCNNADEMKIVCIPDDIRFRSTHLIAKHGMGKSTVLEHMILDDIKKNTGVAVLDPHGDLINRLLNIIPEEYVKRTIYFQPGDPNWIPLWNPIHATPGQDLARTADNIVAAIKNIVTGWGDRLENFFRQSIFALLHLPGATLHDVYNLLRKDSKQSKILIHKLLDVIENDVARSFWEFDFTLYNKNTDLSPPKHKLSKLLLSGPIALMLSQPQSKIAFREIMDTGKILLIDLSEVGAETRDLLGSFVLSLMHIATLSRSSISKDRRKPFHIYCDEAHRFVDSPIENSIVESRKFNVSYTLANQYLGQFSNKMRDSITTAGSTIIFNVDIHDAKYLTKDLQGLVSPEDVSTFEVGDAIARIGTNIVQIRTRPPIETFNQGSREDIIEYSHSNYYLSSAMIRDQLKSSRSDFDGSDLSNAVLSKDYLKPEDFEYEEFE